MTFAAIHSAISTPASASGRMPFGAPDGPMIDLFGRVPVRANLSPRQAMELGLMTSGTFGRPGTGSSRSATLQSPLASKLQRRFQLAHGAAARVGHLHAYGNAINAQQAQIFIEECRKCL